MAAFLRSHRRRAGLSLEALAERTGLTKSYLSKIERGLSTPSIAVALKIAHVLETDVAQLFAANPDNSLLAVARAGENEPDAASPAAHYHPLATQLVGKAMQPFIVHPGTEPGPPDNEHAGDEFIFVHSGTVELALPGSVITLDRGDSLYFDANTPHRLRSVSPERAEVVVIVHDRDAGVSPGAH
ncbi:helix-turn-helix domain-containing protein [Nocardia sp. alder85J]|uniref:helix-turn-helix domain-containing protein n=1 Tax=Nocardia sp. alder85J TaxID=2862949 RepID=UPI001CD2503C|nr:XRE family transcriptional regulator [Nocardia sp. alder85J]MCX4098471.1 XRE family transcriptional regulator [Nocardia sp. alder85J]